MKKKTTIGSLFLLLGTLVLAGCTPSTSESSGSSGGSGSIDPGSSSQPVVDNRKYTLNLADVASPRTWNPHEWETNTDSVIIGYTEIGLYDVILNGDKDGYEVVPEMAAAVPKDVTSTLTAAERARYGVGEGDAGLKWEIDLNPAAKWQDGTEITADDYLFGMSQILAPEMYNRRADSYYSGQLSIGHAREFRYGGLPIYAALSDDRPALDSKEYFSFYDAIDWLSGVFEAGDGPFSILGFIDILVEDYGWVAADDFPTVMEIYESGVLGSNLSPIAIELNEDNRPQAEAVVNEILINAFGADDEEEAALYYDDFFLKKIGENEKIDFAGESKAVGIIKNSKHKITLFLGASISEFFLQYNLSGNWLVKEDVYNAGKTTVNGVTKTTYGTSLATYMGYGPYKLATYQKDKEYRLTKNDQWYGYTDGKHVGQFQTTDIVIQIVPEHATQLLMFEKGEIDEIGLLAEDVSKYINSSNLIYTPESYTRKVTMSVDWSSLAGRQTPGVNKTIQTNIKFREAFSWGIDRLDFTQSLTSGSSPFLAPINNLYVSDAVTGVAYRSTEQGKGVIASVFGNNTTGYDMARAKALLTEAYNEELASTKAGSLQAGDDVVLTFWVYGEQQLYTNYATFLDETFKEIAKGTPLEGKITIEKKVDADYPDRMIAGGADMCFSTWGGAVLDPYGIMEVYIDPKLKYEYGFDPQTEELTLTINGVEETRTWAEWNYELNDGKGKYHGSRADMETRLDVLAGMEEALIRKWLFVSVYAYSNGSLFSHRLVYATLDYVNVVGYGGIRFMTHNFDDDGWAAYKAANTLDYTK